jgi:uncharacterized protein (DUF433 family)
MKPTFDQLWRIGDIAGGQVCIKDTGVIASCIAGMFAAGDSIERLAEEYRVEPVVIEQCIKLMLWACIGQRGTLAGVERRMEALVPLESREA